MSFNSVNCKNNRLTVSDITMQLLGALPKFVVL